MESCGITAPRVTIVGAGNVATHLSLALKRAGAIITGVISKHFESATRLSATLECPAIESFDAIPFDSDYVIIAVNDTAVADVAASLPQINGIVAHTSGSVPLEVLSARHKKAAVIYPLQTFSRDVDVQVNRVPFFTEAVDEETLASIDRLAAMLSPRVFHADSVKRQSLHIAGVLTSNFPVHLMAMAHRVLEDAGFPLDVVQPLVEATIAKVFNVGPHDAMTGPARRGDRAVIDKHISSLPYPDNCIYQSISNAIYNTYHQPSNEQD